MANNIPTFTPPAPTFTPPAGGRGRCCHYHQNDPAVAKCARCKTLLCEDCADTYTVNDDEYAGEPLCYDCCKAIVAANVKQLKKQRAKIIAMYVFTALGMLLGAFIGLGATADDPSAGPLVPIIAAFIGGCCWTFFVNCLKIFWNTLQNFANGAWLGGILWFFIDMIKAIVIAIWGTIQKLFYYTKYLIQTSGFIKSDSQAIQQMDDYMEYTLVRSQNVGVDLATLMNEDSQLHGNAYAQTVLAHGEDQAEAGIRQSIVRINDNGEIIRGFAG